MSRKGLGGSGGGGMYADAGNSLVSTGYSQKLFTPYRICRRNLELVRDHLVVKLTYSRLTIKLVYCDDRTEILAEPDLKMLLRQSVYDGVQIIFCEDRNSDTNSDYLGLNLSNGRVIAFETADEPIFEWLSQFGFRITNSREPQMPHPLREATIAITPRGS